ncbi:MAG: M20/M25/M40 family metallo-hydrolase [Candidatus Pelethousia sp.]|nr:M20/M25/M40 family metallo-hydrolase [Candidatus Pelethousia sp.]
MAERRNMNTSRLTERFLRYVRCSSESRNEQAFCLLIEDEFARLGIPFRRDEVGDKIGSNGWNLIAKVPGEGDPVLFSCHLDTVKPGAGINPILENGIIRSAGDTILGADDKSGIAAVLEALESILEEGAPHRPVEILFSVCEEIGLLGARHADYSRFESKEGLVLDTSEIGLLKNRAPAIVHLHVRVHGKAAHAAVEPEKGVHAIKAAAEAITNIPCGYPDDMTVMNVANFVSQGATNVVPDLAAFDMEIRSFTETHLQKYIRETEEALQSACRTYGASYELTMERQCDPLFVPEDGPLIQKIRDLYARMGIEVKTKSTFGGCDATWICAHGIQAANTGTGMRNAHGVRESIALADLETITRMVYGVIRG